MAQAESTIRRSGGTIHITVSEKINTAQLTELFNSLVKTLPHLSGCTTCGLNGIDLHIAPGGDPTPIEALYKMQGVTGVVLTAR